MQTTASSPNETHPADAATTAPHTESLATQTHQVYVEFLSSLPEQTRQTVVGSLEQLCESDQARGAKRVSDVAPDFYLPSVRGNRVSLFDSLAAGSVVLTFYRGGWCPFCNLELRALQRYLPQIRGFGARVLAVSPELPDASLTTKESLALEFDILSDVGNEVARRYGLVVTVAPEMRPLYHQWGIDLPTANGDAKYELPVPATYVIDPRQVIRAAHVDKDYTKRMEPEGVLAALGRIRQGSPAHL